MARKSSSQGKLGCFPLAVCFVVVFAVLAVWQNREMFGIEGDYDYLTWLGLSKEGESAPVEELIIAVPREDGVTYQVTLRDPVKMAQEEAKVARDDPLLATDSVVPRIGEGISRDYGTATLNQAVLFIFEKSSGQQSKRVMPKGTVVEVAEKSDNQLKIRMMGREGWLSNEAVD